MKALKVGIVDDHILFAEGISNIVAAIHPFEVSFIAATAGELFRQMEIKTVDMLILDINIPGMNGLDILKKLKADKLPVKIMLLTMYLPADIGIDLKNFAGDAYVLKISGKNILEEALLAMEQNNIYIDPNIISREGREDKFITQLKLTKREKEIIELISKGKTSKEIAALLFLSELTIKTHRKNISEKLGTKGIANIVLKNQQLITRDFREPL